MKKVVFLIVLSICCIGIYAQTESGEYGFVKTRFKTNLFTEDLDLSNSDNVTVGEAKIGEIPGLKEVQVLGVDTVKYLFYKVKYKKRIGYIHRSNVFNRIIIARENPAVRQEYLGNIEKHTICYGMNEMEVELSLGAPNKVEQKSSIYNDFYPCDKWVYGAANTFKQVFFYKGSLFAYYSDGWHFKKTSYNISVVSAEQSKGDVKKSLPIIHGTDKENIKFSVLKDDNLTIVWSVSKKLFTFDLTNKSNYSMKIPWDDFVYVDVNLESKRLINSEVKFINKEDVQIPSVVPKMASLTRSIIPSDNISYEKGELKSKSLFLMFCNEQQLNESSLMGKTFRILFPIIINDSRYEYTFEFKIEDIVLE